MKRNLIVLAAFLFVSIACERDDLCLEKPSASVNAVFYNNVTQQREPLEISVLFNSDTIIETQTTDSLLIPLPVHTDDFKYVFIKHQGNSANPDTVRIRFGIGEQFISKACGFKTVYHNLQMNLTPDNDNWIQQIDITNPEVITDTVNHVKIYH